MVFFIIGLGLNDEKDITVKGLEAVKSCDKIYLEAYTSILISVPKPTLEAFYGKTILEADREFVESGCEEAMLEESKTKNIAFLVVGDPFGATTHSDIVVRAKQMGVQVEVIHNASIMNAVACCGLQLYRFGQTVSIVFFDENWRPDSFYDKILANRQIGLHTLCLLDIKMKEQSMENMLRQRKIYEPPRFMTVNTCVEQLIEIEQKRKQNCYDPEKTMCIGVARIGAPTQAVVAGTMKELLNVDFGKPLHSFIICAEDLHFHEKEHLEFFTVEQYNKQQQAASTTTTTQ